MEPVRFSNRPYKVIYKDLHTGELVEHKRQPPPKLHPILPQDQVLLMDSPGQDWKVGDTYRVKFISPRSPNTLQIEKSDGSDQATFVDYSQVKLIKKEATREIDRLDNEIENKYFTWP